MTNSILRIDSVGNKYWSNLEGELHRENGPAVIWATNKKMYWYINNDSHRIDGPACVLISGHRTWWLNNVCVRAFQFNDEV